ncbi:MAG: citrate lyase holo-[acyl-carrier protein] synthase [Thermovirgaceae bacterium]
MKALDRVLSGREGRARLQGHILGSAAFVVQVSLNLPGYPKELPGSRTLVEAVGLRLGARVCDGGGRVISVWMLENGVGPAFFLGVRAVRPETVKEEAMSLEEKTPWGAVLDVDVLLPGGALSRSSLGLPPRWCFLCGRPAKECARTGRHEQKELRRTAEKFLQQGLQETGSALFRGSGLV